MVETIKDAQCLVTRAARMDEVEAVDCHMAQNVWSTDVQTCSALPTPAAVFVHNERSPPRRGEGERICARRNGATIREPECARPLA
jgi:hypothetical protein